MPDRRKSSSYSSGSLRGKQSKKSYSGRKGSSRSARKRKVRILRTLLCLALLAVLGIAALALLRSRNPLQRGYTISQACEEYRPQVEQAADQFGVSEYTDLILAVMMQESSGTIPDVMQAAECQYNTEYPRKPNGITDPQYSIECGIQELKHALELAECTGPRDMDKIRLALQAYNFGSDSFLSYVREHGHQQWSLEASEAFAQMASKGEKRSGPQAKDLGPWNYGDQFYPEHVLRYYHLGAEGDLINRII